MPQKKAGSREKPAREIPAMQRFLDNLSLLLLLGLAVPGTLYILWGLVDIAKVPDFIP